jgi:endonuclease YncB( thermonuclease family)
MFPLAVSAVELVGLIVNVHDGDTVTRLADAKVRHQIRLDGIDAPDRTQPYATIARQPTRGSRLRQAGDRRLPQDRQVRVGTSARF